MPKNTGRGAPSAFNSNTFKHAKTLGGLFGQKPTDKLDRRLLTKGFTVSTPIYDESVKRVTTDETGAPTAKPTAKVRNGAITGIALAVGVAILSAVTPDMLAPLGSWGVLIYSGIVALGSSLAAYLTKPTGIS